MAKAKKTALVFSGGGAKGAFQVAAEKYAREQCGYHWDVVAGVSVGALNAMMIAMEKHDRLWDIWNTLDDNKVYTGRINALSFSRMVLGAKSFYGNDPLWKLVESEFDPSHIVKDVRIGAVSLVTGEYVRFTKDSPDLKRAVLASTAMPLIWKPVDVSSDHTFMVDGAVRNISPLKDVLDDDVEEIIVINCNTRFMRPISKPPSSALGIAMRTLDIMFNEIFQEDLYTFQKMNTLIQQAETCGLVLRREDDSAYRYIKIKIIEPVEPLDDSLNFSQVAIQRSLAKGWASARLALG